MKLILFLFTVIILLNCSASDNYQMQTTSDGSIYRLNKNTGEICLIDQYSIIRIEESTFKGEKVDIKGKKEWSTKINPNLDSLTLDLSTCWREGYLYYVFSVQPFNNKVKKAREDLTKQFTIEITDDNGFNLISIPILLRSMQKIVDDESKPIMLEIRDKIPCSSSIYGDMTMWSVGWNF